MHAKRTAFESDTATMNTLDSLQLHHKPRCEVAYAIVKPTADECPIQTKLCAPQNTGLLFGVRMLWPPPKCIM